MEDVFRDFGEVKRVKHQSHVSSPGIFTGTRLASIVLNAGVNLPRSITVDGYLCRIWYRGQPLICNLCGVQGHKSISCPNKDKCRRCALTGHFPRSCPNAYGVLYHLQILMRVLKTLVSLPRNLCFRSHLTLLPLLAKVFCTILLLIMRVNLIFLSTKVVREMKFTQLRIML